MSTPTLNFREGLDIPKWRLLTNNIWATAAGSHIICDKRNNNEEDPHIYAVISATAFARYSIKNDEWHQLPSPALTGTFGAGAASVFVPDAGPSGILAAGWTNSIGAITTALPAAVGVNQLANRGDGQGYFIKIVGNAVGSSGRTEIRQIIGNTGGTTPIIRLNTPLSFIPIAGDRFEIMAGRIFTLSAGALAAGVWRVYDIATNFWMASLATANLPATIGTDSTLLSLSELHIPHDRRPGEGFLIGAGTYNGGNLNCLTATATTATTLTGQAMAGDNTILANEYRNFQIRIVEDTIPTAVGQRRRIISHTAGPSPVYTVATWTVTPSATARFVIENDTDKILLWSSASATTFNYNIAANTWDTTTWAARPVAVGAGVTSDHAFSIVLDIDKNARHSHIFSIRGGATTAIDLFDIAGAATGAWTGGIIYGGLTTSFTTGTSTEQEPATMGGRYFYINHNATQRFLRFDMLNRTLEGWTFFPVPQGAAVVGKKMGFSVFVHGGVKMGFIFVIQSTGLAFYNIYIQR